MRRLGALAAVVLALALAACTSAPPGTDGDLVDDWPTMAAPKIVPPLEAGSCVHYLGDEPQLAARYTLAESVDSRISRDCATDDGTSDTAHDTETAYVSAFSGADADATTPPAEGSAGLRSAFAVCQTKVDEYLGGDWQNASVWILLVMPSNAAWRGGARWLRCDIGHMDNPLSTVRVMHGSVHNGLSGNHPLAITCLATTEDADSQVQSGTAIGCDMPHSAEYAGYYTAPDRAWPADKDTRNQLALDGCGEIVAHFLGFASAASWNNRSIGYLEIGFDQDRWALGDRSVRCFAYAYTKSKVMIGSVRGIKGGTPKS
jgi:Septum formation